MQAKSKELLVNLRVCGQCGLGQGLDGPKEEKLTYPRASWLELAHTVDEAKHVAVFLVAAFTPLKTQA